MNTEQRKYLRDGQEVELLGLTGYGAIVRRIFDYGEQSFGTEPELVPEVFDKPLVTRLAKEIEDLNILIEQKQVELHNLDSQLEDKLAQSESMRKRLDKHAKLKRLFDFLDGKITHFVRIYSSAVEIVPISEEKCEYGHRGEIRLLSLFGSSNGDLNWKINQYRDGSGIYRDIIPATSIEEATALAVDCIKSKLDECDSINSDLIASARKFSVPIPNDKMIRYLEFRIKTEEDKKLIRIEESHEIDGNIVQLKNELYALNPQANT